MSNDNTASHLQALDGGYLPVRERSLEEATRLDPPPLDRLTAWYRIFRHAHPTMLRAVIYLRMQATRGSQSVIHRLVAKLDSGSLGHPQQITLLGQARISLSAYTCFCHSTLCQLLILYVAFQISPMQAASE